MTVFWRKILGLVIVLGAGALMATGAQAALSAADRDDVARIQAYLNATSTVQARFTQINPDGSRAGGTAMLSRPGRLRLDYDPPAPIQVIADGRFLIYYDKELKQASWLGLDETPAGILVRPNVALTGGNINVKAVNRSGNSISLRMEQAGQPELGEMTMTFDANPLMLRQWVIRDQEGKVTTVVLSNIRTGVSLPNSLFVFENPEFSDPLSQGRGRGR